MRISHPRVSIHLVNHYDHIIPDWSSLINLARLFSPSSWCMILSPDLALQYTYGVPKDSPRSPLLYTNVTSTFNGECNGGGLATLLHRDTSIWHLENALAGRFSELCQWSEFVWLNWLLSRGDLQQRMLGENSISSLSQVSRSISVRDLANRLKATASHVCLRQE